MKKIKLNLYNGTVAGLSTAATTEQTTLGINNKIQKYEPFIMTNTSDITQVGTLTKPSQRLAIGMNADGTTTNDLQEYATLQEVSDLNTAMGLNSPNTVRYVNGTETFHLLYSDPANIVWYNSGSNGTVTLPTLTMGQGKIFIIHNQNPRASGTGVQGFLTVSNVDDTFDSIPPGCTKIYTGSSPNQWVNQDNYIVQSSNNAATLQIDAGLGRRFFRTYNGSPSADVAFGLSCANGLEPNQLYTAIIKNSSTTNYKLTVSLPTTNTNFASSITYNITQNKAREFSVFQDVNGNFYWQVSEELKANA